MILTFICFICWIISFHLFNKSWFLDIVKILMSWINPKIALSLVAVQQKQAVTVRLEEGMVLECLCPWYGNLSGVSWTKIPNKDPVAVFHPEHGVVFSHRYRERIEFLRTTPMDGSISMRNVTHQDIGLYHCSVQTFPQGSWTRNIQVEDLGKKKYSRKYWGGNFELLNHCAPSEWQSIDVGDKTWLPSFHFHHAFRFLSLTIYFLCVLHLPVFADEPPEEDDSTEPPTPGMIKADTELVAEEDKNLTIGCNHEHNGAVDQVMLETMPHGQAWGRIGVCKNVGGGLVGEDYSDRGRVSCTDSLDLSLHLTRVAQQDGGFYRCTFSTDAGVQTTTMLITVSPPGTKTNGMQSLTYACSMAWCLDDK